MTITGRLLSVVRPGERPALTYFFTLLFLTGTGLAVGGGVANALFLKRFGIEHLPWIFLFQGISLALASLVYASLADRMRPERILRFILVFMVTLLLCLWFVAQTQLAAWAHPPLYLLQEICSEILALHFSLYIGAHFDNEQTKRLMPLALAGLQLGELTGGLLLALGSPMVGALHMLWLWLGSGILAWLAVRTWHRRHGATPRRVAVRNSGGIRQTLRQLRQGLDYTWQQRSSVLTVFFTVVALFLLSYLINEAFTRTIPDEAHLAMTFGLVTFVGGGLAFVLQLTLTGRLIERHGVRAVNLVFPLTSLVAMAAFLTPLALTAALLGSFNRRVLLPAVRNPARALMLQALPEYIQGRMRGLSLALVLPLAMVLAGLLIKSLHGETRAIAALGMVLTLLALYFAARANRDYQRTIIGTLKERLYVPRDDLGPMSPRHDATFMAELVAGLDSTDEAMCESFAHTLVQHFGPAAVPVLLRRIPNVSYPCQDRLCRLLTPHLSVTHADAWLALLDACDDHGRATLLTVAFQARWPQAAQHVLPCLESPNPRLTACGIIGALSLNDRDLRDKGQQRLRDLLSIDDVRSHIAAVTALTVIPHLEFRPYIELALQADEPQLRLQALRALLALAQPIHDLTTIASVEQLYRETSWSWPMREACVRLLPLLPPEQRIENLIKALDDPQPQVQKLAINLLLGQDARWIDEPLLRAARQWQLGVRGQAAALSVLSEIMTPARLRELALNYLEQAVQYRAWLSKLEAGRIGGELLLVVMRERIAQLADLGLRALARRAERAITEVVRAAVVNQDRRQRMLCLELIDDLADLELRTLLQRLLHPVATSSDWVEPRILSALHESPDIWLKQCAHMGRSI